MEQPKPLSSSQPNMTPAGQNQEAIQMASLTRLLMEITNYLQTLKMQFRGEALYQGEDGKITWVQVTKPRFIKMDFKTGKPQRVKTKMPWGEEKLLYIPNEEAIDEVLSMLYFGGVNQINPIGFNNPDNYLEDLKEFECKLAGVLCLKQEEWGLDEELLPMIQFEIKTIVQDVRSMAINGNTLKNLISTVQRIEQAIEGGTTKKKIGGSPYS